jgi:hypothetical protein
MNGINLLGLRVIIVDAGTKMTDEATGHVSEVTDTRAIMRDGEMWVTPKTFAAMRMEAHQSDIDAYMAKARREPMMQDTPPRTPR